MNIRRVWYVFLGLLLLAALLLVCGCNPAATSSESGGSVSSGGGGGGGGSTDVVEPYTVNFSPAKSAVNVLIDCIITLNVLDDGDGVDRTSIVMNVEGSIVIPQVTPISGGYAIEYEPSSDFSYDQIVNIVLDASDLNGNAMRQLNYFFVCGTVQDDTAPTVTNLIPAANAVDLPVDDNITFEIDDDNSGVNYNTINVTIASATAVSAGNLVGNFSGSVTMDGNGGFDVSINPLTFFAYEQVVDVVINASDINGNVMTPVSYSFTCMIEPIPPDLLTPSVTSQSPAADEVAAEVDTNVDFEIDDNQSGVDLSSLNMTIKGIAAVSSGVVVGNNDGSVVDDGAGGFDVSINPDSDFAYEEVVGVVINAFDNDGNEMTEKSYSFTCMSEPDLNAPTTANLRPPAGDPEVPVNTDIYFELSDNDSGVNISTLNVTINSDNAIVNGFIKAGFSGELVANGSMGFDVTISPLQLFPINQSVDVVISVSDIDGNVMNPLSYSFYCSAGWDTTTEFLSYTRINHTSTRLADGQVLVTGGLWGGATCEIFDSTSQTWSTVNNMSSNREVHTATLLGDGRVMITGGDFAGYLSSAEIYDPASGNWTNSGSMSVGKVWHTATLLLDGRLLVTGGFGSSSYLAECDIYNPKTSSWAVANTLRYRRYHHTATRLFDGQVLISGGYNSTDRYLTSCELFDSDNDEWDTTNSLNIGRFHHTATKLADGRVLVVGGSSETSYQTGCELYDPASGEWNVAGSLNEARGWHTATLLNNGKVLVVGGYNSDEWFLDSSEVYDPVTDSWSVAPDLNQERGLHKATRLHNGKVLITAGEYYDSNFKPTNSSEIYSYYISDDLQQPQVSNRTPAPGEIDVPTNTILTFDIRDPLPAGGSFYGVDLAALDIDIDGVNIVTGGEFQAPHSGFFVPDDCGGFHMTIDPGSDFTPGKLIEVIIDVSDLAPTPNVMTQVTYSFTCAP